VKPNVSRKYRTTYSMDPGPNRLTIACAIDPTGSGEFTK
jgi:hypothetical protein